MASILCRPKVLDSDPSKEKPSLGLYIHGSKILKDRLNNFFLCELKILKDSQIISSGHKTRTDKALVEAIFSLDTFKPVDSVTSIGIFQGIPNAIQPDKPVLYEEGKIVRPWTFDPCPSTECGAGIHLVFYGEGTYYFESLMSSFVVPCRYQKRIFRRIKQRLKLCLNDMADKVKWE